MKIFLQILFCAIILYINLSTTWSLSLLRPSTHSKLPMSSFKSTALNPYAQKQFTKYPFQRSVLKLKKDPSSQDLQAGTAAESTKEPSVLEQVASKGLAGVLAIALAESIFWALGMPLASIWVKLTTGDWLDLSTTAGQLQAAGFSFGYGGFATAILQYRVTLFAIPLVPVMERLVVEPGRRLFGEKFGESSEK